MSTAATAEFQTAQPPVSSERPPALPLRNDTFLGVCEAIGQDLGFNPNFLRVPFAALLLWNPAVIVGLYLGLGVVVAASRWFFPATKPETVAKANEAARVPAVEQREVESEELLAA